MQIKGSKYTIFGTHQWSQQGPRNPNTHGIIVYMGPKNEEFYI
jgi:hypothetical protein